MQITPSSLQPTAKDTPPGASKVSRRRLFFLAATAAVASGLGIALGGTLRFQVVPVSQAPLPLFKPQQDFPPLAEWPPEVPSADRYNDFDTRWEDIAPAPQLIYNDRRSADFDNHTTSEDDYDSTEFNSEVPLTPSEIPSPIPANLGEDETQDVTDEFFEEESLPPVVSTQTGKLEGESTSTPQTGNPASLTDTPPWLNKRPASEFQFTESPIIISPEDTPPLNNVLSD
ncbi:hypothetical protein N836_12045 [Leptolyngbya sp. Heron Island J]|uniref:hypothetical protein n=1 Tax=Leptolyngbya sp. Heron Island J TaxID=1385935 RepID=UPI0003B98EAB|nr:hypothetical protein [Leptolyngbya sp. Heron Island J]ESA35430.1 hypothetical protein N836_12045 [Leptolyngbya sp. Heron Island J]